MDEISGFPEELAETHVPIRTLGAGAMGQVFLARDKDLGRLVAVKRITAGDETRRARIRFLTEAASLAKIKHPNVVGVYAYGDTSEGPYLVMEYLEGKPLDKPPKGTDPLKIMMQVAAGLDAIHAADLVHRDLKLPNIMLTNEGRAVIVDFGLVLDPNRTRITKDGAFVGTFMCASPEVLHLEAAIPATDWYAWGLNLYVLCEGRFPFLFPQLMKVTEREPLPEPRFERLRKDGRIAKVIRACLREDPKDRPTSRKEISAMLRPAGSTEPVGPGDAYPLPAPPGLKEISETLDALDISRPGDRSGPAERGRSTEDGPGTRRRAGLALGVGAALALGAIALRLGGGEGPTTVPPEGPPPLPADLAERMAQEFAARDPASLDQDPVAWGGLVASLPALGKWLAWLGDGGRPEALSVEDQLALRQVGEAYVAAGLWDPTHPFLVATPLSSPIPLPAELAAPAFASLGLPETVGGWTGAAMVALDEAMREHRRLFAVLIDPDAPAPEGLPPELWAERRGLRDGGLIHFVRGGQALRPPEVERTRRAALSRWLRAGGQAYTQALYAAARACREEPEGGEVVALLLSRLGGRMTPFYYDAYRFASMDPLLGGPARSPAQWFLRGTSLELTAQVRNRHSERSVRGLRRAAREAFVKALEPAPGKAAHFRRVAALWAATQAAQLAAEGVLLGTLWRQHGELRRTADPRTQLGVLRMTAEAVVDDGVAVAISAKEIATLKEELGGLLEKARPGTAQEERALWERL